MDAVAIAVFPSISATFELEDTKSIMPWAGSLPV